MASAETEIIKKLLQLGACLQRQASSQLAEFGLNQQQFVLLKEIDEREPVSQSELCSALLLQKANVSKIASKLVRLGLVQRQQSAGDSRVAELSMTWRGRGVVQRAMARLDRWNEEWLAPLPDSEISGINRSLARLSKLIERE